MPDPAGDLKDRPGEKAPGEEKKVMIGHSQEQGHKKSTEIGHSQNSPEKQPVAVGVSDDKPLLVQIIRLLGEINTKLDKLV